MQGRDRTHCVHGHPFNEANTAFDYVSKTLSTGEARRYLRRRCRACHRINSVVRYHTKIAPRCETAEEVELLVGQVTARMTKEGIFW